MNDSDTHQGTCCSVVAVLFAAAVVNVMIATDASGGLPTLGYARIVPVNPLGTEAAPYPTGTVIDGDTIYLQHGGTNVWFDVLIGGWAPELMTVVQVQIPYSTFDTGSGDALVLPSTVLCSSTGVDPACEAAFGMGAECSDGDCTAAWLDSSRTDALSPLGYEQQWDTPYIQFGWLSLIGGPKIEDQGAPYLLGSFVLKFQAVGGPMRAAAELDPNVINLHGVFVDFKDIAAAVSSFLGFPYDYEGPNACP